MDKMMLFKKYIRITADYYGPTIWVNGNTFKNYSFTHIYKSALGLAAIYYKKISTSKRKLKNIKITKYIASMEIILKLRYEAGKKYINLHIDKNGVRAIHNGKHIDEIPFERRCIIL